MSVVFCEISSQAFAPFRLFYLCRCPHALARPPRPEGIIHLDLVYFPVPARVDGADERASLGIGQVEAYVGRGEKGLELLCR